MDGRVGWLGPGPEHGLGGEEAEQCHDGRTAHAGLAARQRDHAEDRKQLDQPGVGQLPPAAIDLLDDEVAIQRQEELVRQLVEVGQGAAERQCGGQQGDEQGEVVQPGEPRRGRVLDHGAKVHQLIDEYNELLGSPRGVAGAALIRVRLS